MLQASAGPAASNADSAKTRASIFGVVGLALKNGPEPDTNAVLDWLGGPNETVVADQSWVIPLRRRGAPECVSDLNAVRKRLAGGCAVGGRSEGAWGPGRGGLGGGARSARVA